VLLKLYGARGIQLGAFLGGLVNSTVTVTDLSERAGAGRHGTADLTFRGIMLATGAMLIRNAVLLVLIAPATALAAAAPITLMTLAAIGVARLSHQRSTPHPVGPSAAPAHSSPFSLHAALKFGAVFLALQVTGTLAQRTMGEAGFYAVSALGGLVSSATAVASAGNLAAAGLLTPEIAAVGALIASATSALVNLPIVARVAANRVLTLRVAGALAIVIVAGGIGVAAAFMW
jgi:uncharacterized membrane protein (DUF4010 family)